MKKELPDKWQYLNKKLSDTYEYFNSIDDCQKPVDNLIKEDFFGKVKNKSPEDEETQRTKEIIKFLILKMEKL